MALQEKNVFQFEVKDSRVTLPWFLIVVFCGGSCKVVALLILKLNKQLLTVCLERTRCYTRTTATISCRPNISECIGDGSSWTRIQWKNASFGWQLRYIFAKISRCRVEWCDEIGKAVHTFASILGMKIALHTVNRRWGRSVSNMLIAYAFDKLRIFNSPQLYVIVILKWSFF